MKEGVPMAMFRKAYLLLYADIPIVDITIVSATRSGRRLDMTTVKELFTTHDFIVTSL